MCTADMIPTDSATVEDTSDGAGSASKLLFSWTESLGPRVRIRDYGNAQNKASDLQLCRAAYRNRTDDQRITRRIRAVHGRPDGHTCPARAASRSARVRGSPGPLLANPLAQSVRDHRSSTS